MSLLFPNYCYPVLVTNKGEDRHGWFVLVYKLPVEPTRLRASVWRKLKASGALYLHNGVVALPEDAAGERCGARPSRYGSLVGQSTFCEVRRWATTRCW
jgi:hypothetical protein